MPRPTPESSLEERSQWLADLAVDNGEGGAQVEIKDKWLRESMVLNVQTQMLRGMREAVAIERERCAKLMDAARGELERAEITKAKGAGVLYNPEQTFWKKAAALIRTPPKDEAPEEPDNGTHYHITELRGVAGVTLYSVQHPCSKCDWGH